MFIIYIERCSHKLLFEFVHDFSHHVRVNFRLHFLSLFFFNFFALRSTRWCSFQWIIAFFRSLSLVNMIKAHDKQWRRRILIYCEMVQSLISLRCARVRTFGYHSTSMLYSIQQQQRNDDDGSSWKFIAGGGEKMRVSCGNFQLLFLHRVHTTKKIRMLREQ